MASENKRMGRRMGTSEARDGGGKWQINREGQAAGRSAGVELDFLYHHRLYPRRLPDHPEFRGGPGHTVRSRSVFGTIGATLQTLVGGNISLFTELCEHAGEAFQIMVQHAEELGANAVIGVRYDAAEVMQGTTEVLCYGTAVLVEPG